MNLPEINSSWKHHNGNHYTVLHIANEPDEERYPCMIVYQGTNGKVWARKATDWHRSMTLQEFQSDASEAIHSAASGLFRSGGMDEKTMKSFDKS
jgi:hypothetical protein